MKKYLTTIITVCVLVVAIVGLILVLNVKNKNAENNPETTEDTEETENTSSYLNIMSDELGNANYTQDNVVKAETSYNGNQYTLEKVDGSWCCTSHTFKTYETTISDHITNLMNTLGIRIDDVENVAEYGFGEDLSANPSVKVTMDDGTSQAVYVGDLDFTQNYRYVYNPSVPTRIYKVALYTVSSALMIEKEDLIRLKAFSFSTSDTPIYVIVKENGEQTLKLTFKEFVKTGTEDDDVEWSWHVNYPVDRDSSNDKINTILTSMQGMALSSLSDEAVPESELGEYGLDVPIVEYYFYAEDSEGVKTLYSIKVGGLTEDEEYYYCLVTEPTDGYYDIFTVQVGYIYKSVNAIDFIDSYLYVEDSDNLESVEFTLNGETHKMTFVHTPQGEDEDDEIAEYFDGIECIYDDNYSIIVSDSRMTVPTEDDRALNKDSDVTNDVVTANPYDCFNRLLNSFYIITLHECQVEAPAEELVGEEIFRIKYTELDGTETLITFMERDETTAYAYINGTFAGGYIRTHSIFGDDYESFDVAASLKGMKAVLALLP